MVITSRSFRYDPKTGRYYSGAQGGGYVRYNPESGYYEHIGGGGGRTGEIVAKYTPNQFESIVGSGLRAEATVRRDKADLRRRELEAIEGKPEETNILKTRKDIETEKEMTAKEQRAFFILKKQEKAIKEKNARFQQPSQTEGFLQPPISRIEASPEREGLLGSAKGFVEQSRFSFISEESKGFPSTKTIASTFVAGVLASGISTYEFGKELITSPVSTLKRTGSGLKVIGKRTITGEGFPEISDIIKREPVFSLGFLTGEIAQAKVGGKVLQESSKLVKSTKTRLSPGFTPVVDDTIKVTTKGGLEKEIKIGGSVEALKEPLSKQVKVAGSTTDAVSAQRGLFTKFGKSRTTITVDKPLPAPDAPPIERSFFADPSSRLRPSRLGIVGEQPTATITDILSGDVIITRAKPQGLIFPDTPVEKFPSSLRSIETKLKQGKQLTTSEAQKLLKFQLEPSGKFKPVGFLSQEPEITLAPGEIIRKEKQLGTTIIKGETVPIFEASVQTKTPLSSSISVTEDIAKQFQRASKTSSGRLRPLISSDFITSTSIVSGSVIPRKVSQLSLPVSGALSKEIISSSASLPVSRLSTNVELSRLIRQPISQPSRSPLSKPRVSLIYPQRTVSPEVSLPVSQPTSPIPSLPPSIPPSLPPSKPPSLPPYYPRLTPPTTPPKTPSIYTLPEKDTTPRLNKIFRKIKRNTKFQKSLASSERIFRTSVGRKATKKTKVLGGIQEVRL